MLVVIAKVCFFIKSIATNCSTVTLAISILHL